MRNPYKTREGGATVSVFVPYDCKNNCPFCINKEEYKDMSCFSLEKICESIRLMDSITPRCDFVFTGGEPLADLEGLQQMLDCIGPDHRIFINTTMPVSEIVTEDMLLAFFEKNKEKITCVNISRHMQHFVVESNDHLLAQLPVHWRVNCVLYKNYPKDKLVPFIKRFLPIPGSNIQFRFDYTATTPENLYEKDHIIADLSEIAKFTGLDGCRMRNGFHFEYSDPDFCGGKTIECVYHKTLPYSTMVETDPEDGITYDILYDILIKQTGEIRADWSEDELKGPDLILDIEGYRNVKFEPNDQHWIS